VEKYQYRIVDWEGQQTKIKQYFSKKINRSNPSPSPHHAAPGLEPVGR